MFVNAYEDHFTTGYYWQAKDAAALNKIIKQIRFMDKDADDQFVTDNFSAIIQTVLNNKHKNKWLYDNFSVTMIQSKFNEILNQYNNIDTGGMDLLFPTD